MGCVRRGREPVSNRICQGTYVDKHTAMRPAVILASILAAAVLSAQGGFAGGQSTAMARAVLCRNLAGSYVGAPKWEVRSDGALGQDVRLEFNGKEASSKVTWRRNGAVYYEIAGIGMPLPTGFLIFIKSEDQVETYVYNAGTTEVLFSATRSSNGVLPNSIKGFRGTCVGVGG